LFLVVFGILYVDTLLDQDGIFSEHAIDNYDDCVKSEGSVILESYPPQCRTQDGETFAQDIGNELELQNTIRVASPRPQEEITSPLTIIGEARGSWYFEGDFSIRLLNSNDKEIAFTNATAQEDWMSEDFVPFRAVLNFKAPILSTKGTLVFEKSNPSGLPQQDLRLYMPINFGKKDNSDQNNNECIVTGCSSQVCADREVITSCEYLPQYACYQNATCQRQTDGECGWTMSSELSQCLGEY